MIGFFTSTLLGEPFPILKYDDGTVRCLEEDELPVAMPEVKSYEPSGTGESPLATIDEWLNVTCPKTGKPAKEKQTPCLSGQEVVGTTFVFVTLLMKIKHGTLMRKNTGYGWPLRRWG